MVSTLTWLDHDSKAQEKARDVLQLFTESGTRDELGIGPIRDSISDQLFPGTSVIQTRLRYMLLAPWLLMDMEAREIPSAKFQKTARDAELRLNAALRSEDGAFGKSSGDDLQRLASEVYWAGLGSWGIRLFQGTQQDYFRRMDSFYKARRMRQRRDDNEWMDPARGSTWHHSLADLRPKGELIEGATLRVRKDEAQFIREQWRKCYPGSLLTWLAFDEASLRSRVTAESVWLHTRSAEFPPAIQQLVEHGRRFSKLMEGAALMYNLLLSEKWAVENKIEQYRDRLAEWNKSLPGAGIGGWDLSNFWLTTDVTRHVIKEPAKLFVRRWRDVVLGSTRLADSPQARQLVEQRERQVKPGRSRFDQIGTWRGEAGLVPLAFRWHIAKSYLNDLAEGLGVP